MIVFLKMKIAVGTVLQVLFLLSTDSADTERNGLMSELNLGKGWNNQPQRQMSKQNSIGDNQLQTYMNTQKCFEINVWFEWDNTTKSCHCGSDINGIVLCDTDTKELLVFQTSCLTIEHNSKGQHFPIVGSCVFNYGNFTNLKLYLYYSTPTDCGSLNRQGTLCGQCLDGYTVPAYSYDLKCIRCDSQLENWGLYIVFAFLRLTVFIVITLVFRINVLSPELNTFVLAAQCISAPAFVKFIVQYLSQNTFLLQLVRIPTIVILTIYGFWNLDFFSG